MKPNAAGTRSRSAIIAGDGAIALSDPAAAFPNCNKPSLSSPAELADGLALKELRYGP